MAKYADSSEEAIQKRKREADERKKRTLEMYDAMAKSAPAGGQKVTQRLQPSHLTITVIINLDNERRTFETRLDNGRHGSVCSKSATT